MLCEIPILRDIAGYMFSLITMNKMAKIGVNWHQHTKGKIVYIQDYSTIKVDLLTTWKTFEPVNQ